MNKLKKINIIISIYIIEAREYIIFDLNNIEGKNLKYI